MHGQMDMYGHALQLTGDDLSRLALLLRRSAHRFPPSATWSPQLLIHQAALGV